MRRTAAPESVASSPAAARVNLASRVAVTISLAAARVNLESRVVVLVNLANRIVARVNLASRAVASSRPRGMVQFVNLGKKLGRLIPLVVVTSSTTKSPTRR